MLHYSVRFFSREPWPDAIETASASKVNRNVHVAETFVLPDELEHPGSV